MAEIVTQGRAWLRTNTAKKTLIIIVAVLLVLNLSLVSISDTFRDNVRFWPVDGGSSAVEIQIPDVPATPLNNSQFAERGKRVELLARWADVLLAHPTQDRAAFEEALVTQFPLLGGALDAIYMPWSREAKGLPRSPQPSFVIAAGSRNVNMASHLIRTLRRVHGSQFPIEVAYAGEEDLKPEHRRFLADLEAGVSFIDLLKRFPAAEPDLVKGGWAMKPFALLAAASPRAVLMDADALFLTSPDALFDTHPGLQRTGTLFFHDRAMRGGKDARRKWVQAQFDAVGRQPSTYLANDSLFWKGQTWWEQESGVVAVDRANPRALLGLIFAAWMNTKVVREEVTYRNFHGDKETFWLAMELSGFDYFFQPWYAGMLGTITEGQTYTDLAKDKVEVCGRHMVHLDHSGMPLWINAGVYDNKDHPDRGYAKLTHYLTGNVTGERPDWQSRGGLTCLKGRGVRSLPDDVASNLRRIIEEASAIDKMIKDLSTP
jgi:hypothetical protein